MRKPDPFTGDLFEVPQPADPIPAALDYRAQVAHLVAEALKQADQDRFDIAADMSRLTGREITKYMLDAYASEGRETFNLPLWEVPALEQAAHTHVLTNWLVGVRGGKLLIGREALNAELGKLERLRDQAARQIRDLKKRMGEVEDGT